MNSFKKLYKKLFPDPPPPKQVELQLGRLSAFVILKNSDEYNFEFKGEYEESKWCTWFDVPFWRDEITTAKSKFENWKQKIKDSGFLRIDDRTYFPMHEIAKIRVLEGELVVMSNRSWGK